MANSIFQLLNTAGGSGSALTQDISQVAHGFSVGDWVYLNGSTYTVAANTSAAAAEVVGVVSVVPDVDNFTLQTAGRVTGLSGLTSGTVYFLGLAGALTATAPTTITEVVKPLLIADGTTSGYIQDDRGNIIGTTTNQDYELISTATASTSASIEFTGLSSTYAAYQIIVAGIQPVNDGVALYFRTSTDGGATFDAGASDYMYAMNNVRGDNTPENNASAGAAQIVLNRVSQGNNAAAERDSHNIIIFNPSATDYTDIVATGRISNNSATPNYYSQFLSGTRLSAADVDAVQFIYSAGDILTGEFRLYGLRGA